MLSEFPMRKVLELDNLFFAVFLSTIAFIRLFLLMWPISSPVVLDFHFHHYIYGLLIIIMSLCFNKPYVRTTIFAIGLGFFADEVPMFFKHPWNWQVYDASWDRLATIFVALLVYWFRGNLTGKISKPIKVRVL